MRSRHTFPVRPHFLLLLCEYRLRRNAFGHESSRSSCFPSPGTSCQAKRSSPSATRDNRVKSQPKRFCISFPSHLPKGVFDAASSAINSRSAHSGPSASKKTIATLPRKALMPATRMWPRCAGVGSIPRTLRSENSKAPARTASRAPPDQPGHPRPAARSYPPSPVLLAAMRSLLRPMSTLFWCVPSLRSTLMPPAAISPKGRFNQGGARSCGAHLNHLSSGLLRKRCGIKRTKVREEKMLRITLLSPP